MRRSAVSGLVLAALSLAACGTRDEAPGRVAGRTLTIYAGLPLQGSSGVSGEAALSGAQMALAQDGGRIGPYRIVLRALDDATLPLGRWDAGQTTTNARLAVKDPSTIGYLGDLDSGASAVSIPVLNGAGIPQVSPGSTAVGLTSAGAGAAPGEPDKYYPTGVRTFVRVAASDAIQAAVQVRLQRTLGCTGTYVVDDGEVDGEDFALTFDLAAKAAGLQVLGTQAFIPRALDYTSLARGVAASGANCILVSAIPESGAATVTRQLAAALPNARLFGSAGLAESTFAAPARGGVPVALDPRILITSPALGASAYPAAGRRFLAAYAARYGDPEPEAILGYEAMSVLLSAIRRATHDGHAEAERAKVRAALFAIRDRHSVLGTYSIEPTGDPSTRVYGVWRIVDGHLRFYKPVDG